MFSQSNSALSTFAPSNHGLDAKLLYYQICWFVAACSSGPRRKPTETTVGTSYTDGLLLLMTQKDDI
ncbi:MAG TPA: hypothetical protein V6C97_06120, partial [Oculatellaceae cyanobacterium]